MNKELKETLKNAYSIPKPVKTNKFIYSLKMNSKKQSEFFINQIFYIRHSTIVLFAAIILLFVFVLNTNSKENSIWLISIIPFCVLPLFLEIARSEKYNMQELELSCQFNLRQIILTRFTVLGGMGLLILLTIAPITVVLYSSWVLALGLLVSFFSASALCLVICEKTAGNELLYVSAAAVVSIFWNVTKRIIHLMNQSEIIMLLIFIFAILLVFCILTVKKIIKSKEEFIC